MSGRSSARPTRRAARDTTFSRDVIRRRPRCRRGHARGGAYAIQKSAVGQWPGPAFDILAAAGEGLAPARLFSIRIQQPRATRELRAHRRPALVVIQATTGAFDIEPADRTGADHER